MNVSGQTWLKFDQEVWLKVFCIGKPLYQRMFGAQKVRGWGSKPHVDRELIQQVLLEFPKGDAESKVEEVENLPANEKSEDGVRKMSLGWRAI